MSSLQLKQQLKLAPVTGGGSGCSYTAFNKPSAHAQRVTESLYVCLSVCHSQDLGDSIVLTLKTSINAKQIMFHSSTDFIPSEKVAVRLPALF